MRQVRGEKEQDRRGIKIRDRESRKKEVKEGETSVEVGIKKRWDRNKVRIGGEG